MMNSPAHAIYNISRTCLLKLSLQVFHMLYEYMWVASVLDYFFQYYFYGEYSWKLETVSSSEAEMKFLV